MANSFAVQLADALRNSWAAVARPNQLPPPGDWWQIWLLLAGRGFGKTCTLAEWVCDQVASGQAGRIALVAATAADAREERYSFRRTAMVSAGIRALETPADLAQWSNRNDINRHSPDSGSLGAKIGPSGRLATVSRAARGPEASKTAV